MNFSLALLGFQKAGDMYTEFWEEKKKEQYQCLET